MFPFFLLLITSAFAQNNYPCPMPDETTTQAFVHIKTKNNEELIKLLKTSPQLKTSKNQYCERLYHYAIRARNEEARKILDKHGFGPKKKNQINESFDDRESYFDWALKFGLPSTYDDLKKRGGKTMYEEIFTVVNACNNSGLITHIASKGTNVNDISFFGYHTLTEASKKCKFEIAQELLNLGAYTTSISKYHSPLLEIIKRKVEPYWIEAYLKAGADLSIRYDKDITNYTALMFAAEEGTYEAVKLLLDYGSEINATSAFDGTALHYAIKRNEDPEIIKLLLERGANPNIQDGFYGYTPFLEACHNQPVKILELLELYGADVSFKTYGKVNCLHRTVSINSLEVIKWVGRKLGPNYDYADKNNLKPSDWISWQEHEKYQLLRKIESGQEY